MENNAYRVQPKETARGAVVFLHGLGDSGQGWSMEFKQRLAAHRKDVAFIFPNAPDQKVTLNMGMKMPSWFDLHGLSPDSKEDKEGIESMSKKVSETVDAIIKEYKVPAEKVVIAGFSQGGALALVNGLTGPHNFAGIIALSTWLPLRNEILQKVKAEKLPIMFGHGTVDPVVGMPMGEASAQMLEKAGFSVEFKKYRGVAHSSCAEEFGDIKRFLDKVL